MKGVFKGLPEQPIECGKCGTDKDVRWVAVVTPHYTFSGYLCQKCEPTTGPSIIAKPAELKWDTLEEDVRWACEKVYNDSHKVNAETPA